MRIGLISDTHGYIEPKLRSFFKDVDEIWHAGDIGHVDVLNELREIAPIKAVYGNIDDSRIRNICPKNHRFYCEELDVFMTHIGGYPGKYHRDAAYEIRINPPDLFISGHSHILKVMNDKTYKFLHINPGAIGKAGFHAVRTAVRFTIAKNNISGLEVLELPR